MEIKMLDDMKLKDLIVLVNALGGSNKPEVSLWKVGEAYFIRTVTMHIIGILEVVNDTELLLKNASWIADSGRFNNALQTGELNEVEPFVNEVIVNRATIIDATIWSHKTPDRVK
jgi:hypothetical protein